MYIRSQYRDTEPKAWLLGDGFVGDQYPLCTEAPSKAFLRKGAKWVYNGPEAREQMHYQYSSQYSDDTNTGIIRFHLNASSSALYAALCGNAAGDEECSFSSEVVLAEDLPCDGTECKVDAPRVVRLPPTAGRAYAVYFEYGKERCSCVTAWLLLSLLLRRLLLHRALVAFRDSMELRFRLLFGC